MSLFQSFNIVLSIFNFYQSAALSGLKVPKGRHIGRKQGNSTNTEALKGRHIGIFFTRSK